MNKLFERLLGKVGPQALDKISPDLLNKIDPELINKIGPELLGKIGPDVLPKIMDMVKSLLSQGKTEGNIISEVTKRFNISEDVVKSILSHKK